MNPISIWRRSEILIVGLGVATLLYAALLVALFLQLPSDGYSSRPIKEGFAVEQSLGDGKLEKDDIVTHIDGHDLGNGLLWPGTWYQRIFAAEQSTLVYTFVRDGQAPRSTQIPLTRAPLEDVISRIGILFLLGLVFVINGLVILLRRGQERAGRLMALALITQGLNLTNNTFYTSSINVSAVFYWLSAPVDLCSFWITFGLLLHLFMIFPQESKYTHRRRLSLLALYIFNPLVSGIGGLILGGGDTLATRVAIYRLGYPIAGAQLILALGLLAHNYRNAKQPLVRSQIRWILWGIVVGASGWLLLFALPVMVTGDPLVNLSLSMIPMVAVPISLTFAMTRYRLLDIDRLINRSLVYGALSILLVVGYFIDVAIISRVLQTLTGRQDDTTIVFLSTLTVALVFVPVRTWVQRAIDRSFYPSKLNFERLLRQASRELSTTLFLDDLIKLLTETIPQRLDISGALLFVLDQSTETLVPYGTLAWDTPLPYTHYLQDKLGNERVTFIDQRQDESVILPPVPDAEIWLPLSSRGQLIGLYTFGPKRSGDLYSGDEVEILVALRHQVAIALENTRLYHQVEIYNQSLQDLVRQRTRELEQAHETVAGERNKLDAVLNTIADGLVVTDTHNRVTLTNPVFEGIVARPSSHLVDRPLFAIIPDENLQTIIRAALSDSTQVFSDDLTLDQNIYRAAACALRAQEPGDEISGVVTVLRDVTHEVAVDRMKTDFISVVSHELRTPLTSVLGFAKLIRRTFARDVVSPLTASSPAPLDRAGDGKAKKLQRAIERIYTNLDIIESESMRLTRLINDVLDIAKMEAGKIEWREQKIVPQEVIRNAVASISALADQKDLPVVVDLGPLAQEKEASPPVTLWGDLDRLVQVMTNLLSNAVKFTDRGQITVRCELIEAQKIDHYLPPTFQGSFQPSSDLLLISITDTGVGIALDDLDTVFVKFKQVGDTLTDRPRGTGLGLPICKEIIEHHGGVIWVESEAGSGSTFTFVLPVLSRPAQAPVQEPAPAGPETYWVRRRVSERLPVKGERPPLILVVDDEANIRRLLDQELTEAGYRVVQAADGVQALAQARRQHPDLIILDVMMPGVSGFDVTSALKADERTADIPILILSIIEDRQRGLQLGANEYLTKPVDTDRLLDTIAGLLNKVETAPATKDSPGRKKVLVVDNDISVVETITRALRARGFEVVEAYDPRGAIERVEAEKPDLVILDAMLSQMNDYELLKALRYQDPEQRLNVIVLSGETSLTRQPAPPPDQTVDDLDTSQISEEDTV